MFFSFLRRKKPPRVTDTFVEATGGGWSDPPSTVPADGGSQADFVGQTLDRARAYMLEQGIVVDQEFTFVITDIPVGISNPHEIIFGMMMRAPDYGLDAISVANEQAVFIRMS